MSRIPGSRAFAASGRFSVMVEIPLTTSCRTVMPTTSAEFPDLTRLLLITKPASAEDGGSVMKADRGIPGTGAADVGQAQAVDKAWNLLSRAEQALSRSSYNRTPSLPEIITGSGPPKSAIPSP